jgi:hypothetical protein
MKILSLLVTILGLFLLTGCATTGTVTYVEPYPTIWIGPGPGYYPYWHHPRYFYPVHPPIHRPPVFIHPRPVPPPVVRPPMAPRPIPPAVRPSPGRPPGRK